MRTRMILVVCLVLAFVGTGNGAVPASITAQGKLTDSSGTPLTPGNKSFSFRIFNSPTLGTQIWPAGGISENQNLTTDPAGLWIGLVGASSPLNDAVFADSVRWLEVSVSGQVLPRIRLVTGPYAMRVGTVDGATGGQISGMVTTTGIAEGLRIQGPGVGDANEAYLRFTDHAGTSTGYVGDANPGNPDIYLLSSTGGVTVYTAAGTALMAKANGDVTTGMNGGVIVAPATLGLGNNARLSVGDNTTNSTTAFVGTYATGGTALHVYASGFSGQKAAIFQGDVVVSGTLTKPAGSFKIDHPLDPANKYLSHSFVESPDMKNVYDGVVVTDASGNATITMPNWFEALNKDFRYQLTVIGQFAQAIVSKKIAGNRFSIRSDKPNVEVSWQVTGIRQDAYANAHRIPVEEVKADDERGFYLHPELFGQPEDKDVELARRPEMMKQKKDIQTQTNKR